MTEEHTSKNIGIFGGSFNPIHIGHTALANWIVEQGYVDEVWFVVSPLNPLKEAASLLDAETRLKLVRLAIGDYAKFKVSTIEFDLPRPNYMYQTLEMLQRQHPTYHFKLLIGLDNWLLFSHWKHAAQLVADYRLLVYPRPGYVLEDAVLPEHVHYLQDVPVMDISSTMICQALNEGKNMQFFLSPNILDCMKALFPALRK